MATRPASKLNLQELGIPDEIELVDKQARQSIENMIDDTTTASTSTWSSEKITDEIEDKTSVTKTTTGNPIELTDAASAPIVKCVTEIQGSQDLHGYDKPWVGGAGKNKLNLSFSDDVNTISGMAFSHTDSQFTLNGTATTPSYYSLTFSTPPNVALSTDYTFSITVEGTIPSGLFSLVFYNGSTPVFQARVNTTDSKKKTFQVTSPYDKCVLLMESIQNGGAYNCTIKTQLEVGSTATTFAPYSNICPITAYTEGEIEVRGKNLCSGLEMHSFDSNGLNNDGPNNRVRTPGYIKVDSSMSYTVNAITSVSGKTVQASVSYYETDDFTTPRIGFSNWVNVPVTVAVPSRTKYVRFLLRFSDDANVVVSYFDNVQLEKGETATTYEPYTSTTHTTTFPSAIYRGSEDVVNGKVTSTWGSYTFTGSEGWTQQGSVDKYYSNAYLVAATAKLPATNVDAVQLDTPIGIFTESYTGLESKTYSMCISRDGRIGITADIYADISMLTGMTIWFELATPTTSSVTPTNLPIKSLLGYNHIESSTGDMEIEYITQDYQPLVDLIESNTSVDVYSTTPQKVGKWFNGEDVYEVSVRVSQTEQGYQQVDTGISADAKAWIVEGYAISPSTATDVYSSPIDAYYSSANPLAIPTSLYKNTTSNHWDVTYRIGSELIGGEAFFKVRYVEESINIPTHSMNLSNSETDQVDGNVLDTDSDTDAEDA